MEQVPIPLTTLSTSPASQSQVGKRSPMVCPLAKLGRSSPGPDGGSRYRNLLDPSVYSCLRGIPSPLEPSIYIHQSPSTVSDPVCYRDSKSPGKDEIRQQNLSNQKSYGSACPDVAETSFRGFSGLVNDSYFRNGNPSGSNNNNNNNNNSEYRSLMPSSECRRDEVRSPFRSSSSKPETPKGYQEVFGSKTEASLFQRCLLNRGGHFRSEPSSRDLISPSPNHAFHYQGPRDVDSACKLRRSSPSLDQGYHTLVSPSPGPSTSGPWTDCDPLSPSSASGKAKKFSGTKSTFSPFDRLTDESVVKIFSWLDSCDLCICARVCKRWKRLAWEPQLWTIVKLSGENVCGDKAVRSVLRRLCGRNTTGACPTVDKVLVSDGAKITDKGLMQLSRRCTELTHLQLHGCTAVTNNAIVELATKCTNLQHLDLTGCSRVSCLSVASGPEPPRLILQYLDLTDCPAVDDGGLKVIVRNCPQLVYLYLRRCVQITDAGIKFIPSFCSMLRELSVSDCNRVTDFGLHELAKLAANLRYLSVAKCDRVSDAGLKVIARRCYKLRYLNARGCEAVSDDAISVLARSCPRLRALDIGKCDVSDAGLRAIAESCPNLKKLSLRNCDLVTDRGVQCIAYYCRGLQQLNIQDCQISIEGYRAVKKYCKRCVIEHTNPGFF